MPRHLGADAVDLLDEGGGEHVGGVALGHGAAVAQDEEPVALHRGEVEVVQRDHRGDRQTGDQVEQVQLVLDVEVVGRLVQQQFARFLGEGAGTLGPLAFAAGEGVPRLGGPAGQAGAFQGDGDGPLVGDGRRAPGAAVRDAAEFADGSLSGAAKG